MKLMVTLLLTVFLTACQTASDTSRSSVSESSLSTSLPVTDDPASSAQSSDSLPDTSDPASSAAESGSDDSAGESSSVSEPASSASSEPASEENSASEEKGEVLDPAAFALEPAFPALAFVQPLYFTTEPDSQAYAYVVERTGTIKRFENSPDTAEAAVFLDISDRITISGQEQGLLGFAFHPDFQSNGFFYVYYTNSFGSVISRFETDETDPGLADPESEQVLLTFAQPYANHNGGHLAFGPDGYLYIASGDGGSAGDPQGNAQNKASLLGKILRINVDRSESDQPYAIPADNPFNGNEEGFREEIYAYGLRNPWRFSFDRLTGELWAGDVGQDMVEEIDVIESGGNYGWNLFEGTATYSYLPGESSETFIEPVWEYTHDLGQSATGGYVYRGSAYPELQGWYVYADFVSGTVWALERSPEGLENRTLLETDLLVSSFGEDSSGELYLVDFNGGIYRIIKY